jgi:hypothetical protein
MKWHRRNGLPDNPDFEPESEGGWMKLPEPPAEELQQHAVIFLAISLPLLVLAWAMLPGRDGMHDIAIAGGTAIVLLLPLVVAHEGIHLLLYPGMGRSDQSLVGGSSKHDMLYAMYFGEMSRARYVVILLGPFVVLTVLPWPACLAIGRFVPWAAGLSVLNGMFACGDLMGAWLILRGSPDGARLRNRGYYTWWRPRLRVSS